MKSLSCVLIYKLSVHGLLLAASLLLPTWSFIRRPQHAISTSHRPRSGLPKPTGRIPHCSDKDALPHWLPAHEHRHFYLQTTTKASITRLDSSPARFSTKVCECCVFVRRHSPFSPTWVTVLFLDPPFWAKPTTHIRRARAQWSVNGWPRFGKQRD